MTRKAKTVLLVEDNEDNRIVYSTILRHFGYTVTEALNGEEGIAKARGERPDLILMDISIPIIDGWEATQVLKHDPATRDIPIIALTAHALASDREKAMEVGCDGYLALRAARRGGRGAAIPRTRRGCRLRLASRRSSRRVS
jgi:two-component system, cell cycle response regulator DivK